MQVTSDQYKQSTELDLGQSCIIKYTPEFSDDGLRYTNLQTLMHHTICLAQRKEQPVCNPRYWYENIPKLMAKVAKQMIFRRGSSLSTHDYGQSFTNAASVHKCYMHSSVLAFTAILSAKVSAPISILDHSLGDHYCCLSHVCLFAF